MPISTERPIEREDIESEVPYQPSPDLWKMIIERQDIGSRLRHILSGDVEVNGKWESLGSPYANAKGIRWFMTVVSSYLSVDKLLTDLSEEEVNDMAMRIGFDVIDKIAMCWEEFDIKKSDMFTIVDIINDFVFTALSASREGTLLEAMKPTYRRLETYKPEEGKRKFSWIPFFGR